MPNYKFSVKKVSTLPIKKKMDELKNGLTQNESKTLGNIIIDRMKSMVAVGLSPISGKGRFQGYKNPQKYPGKKKPSRPVNLNLTGKFLASLKATNVKSSKGYQPTIGFGGDRLSNKKEQGHREGANGQAERPIIPDGSKNETVAKLIATDVLTFTRQILNSRVGRR